MALAITAPCTFVRATPAAPRAPFAQRSSAPRAARSFAPVRAALPSRPALSRNVAARSAGDSGTSTSTRLVTVANVEEFDALLAKGGLTFIDYAAEWCGPCKIIAPHFAKMSEADTCKDATFAKVDVGKFPKDFAAKYNVKALPTFHAFKDGELVDAFVGARAAELTKFIDKHT